jgi:hypothetical protein
MAAWESTSNGSCRSNSRPSRSGWVPEGNKFRWRSHPVSAEFIEIWRAFAAEHASLTIADINAELVRIDTYQKANPHPPRAAVAGLFDRLRSA